MCGPKQSLAVRKPRRSHLLQHFRQERDVEDRSVPGKQEEHYYSSLKGEVDSLTDEGAENGQVLFEKSVGMGFRAQVLTNLN